MVEDEVSTYRIGTRRTMLGRRMASVSYRRGLTEGLGAPALFFAASPFARTRAIDASLRGAWQRVGNALETARAKKGEEIGQGSRQTTQRDAAD